MRTIMLVLKEEIIYNLSKPAGLARIIAAMRSDIDNIDEHLRHTNCKGFQCGGFCIGNSCFETFSEAVCQSKQSWQARYSGINVVQQISILMGCAVLPHLMSLVEIIEHGLSH